MKEDDKNKVMEYSKKTPLYLSRRKFDDNGLLTEVMCVSCKAFKSLKKYSKNKKNIDGINNKCKACKGKKSNK